MAPREEPLTYDSESYGEHAWVDNRLDDYGLPMQLGEQDSDYDDDVEWLPAFRNDNQDISDIESDDETEETLEYLDENSNNEDSENDEDDEHNDNREQNDDDSLWYISRAPLLHP